MKPVVEPDRLNRLRKEEDEAIDINLFIPTSVEFIPITLDMELLKERQKALEEILIKTGVPPQLL